MSWKSIEMQVALPRTQDTGKMQEQIQKQSEQVQGALTQSQLEEEKIKRTRVNQSGKSEKVKLKKERINKSSDEMEEHLNNEEDEIAHPYLGKRIDLNG